MQNHESLRLSINFPVGAQSHYPAVLMALYSNFKGIVYGGLNFNTEVAVVLEGNYSLTTVL